MRMVPSCGSRRWVSGLALADVSVYGAVPVDRDTRYRVSATTRREGRIEPFEVVRTSRNALIMMGRELVPD